MYLSFSDMALGILLALRGQESGIDQFEKGFSKHMAMGVRMLMPHFVVNHARGLFGVRNIAATRGEVGVAQKLLSATGQRWTEAEISRLDGDVCLVEGNVAASIACYENAIKVAREQGAKSLELRATMRFHNLRRSHSTILLDAGVPLHRVAKRIGDHPAPLLRTYAMPTKAKSDKMTDAVNMLGTKLLAT